MHRALVILLAACTPPAPVSSPIQSTTKVTAKTPTAALFGRTDDNGRFLRLSELQHVKGKSFGWRIQLPCHGPVEFVETMKLPAPGDWRTLDTQKLPETTISKDGTVATTHDWVACYDGWIEHAWRLAEGDPPGDWKITVEIDGFAPIVWPVRFVK